MPGLYIHIPFCIKKCNYCDFYSVPGQTKSINPYVMTILHEAEKYYGMEVDTIYIGGGTPSLLGAVQLEKLISGLSNTFKLCKLQEASIEVNPESASPEFLKAAISLGINRVSIGIQSLNDAELQASGRVHNASQAVSAIENAFVCGFKDVSGDIIVGLPGQSISSLNHTLQQLTSMRLTHLSAYCLSIEAGTYFALNPPAHLADNDQQADLFKMVIAYLKQSGFSHYEISNFALPGRECQHNLNYWRGGDYVGLGPSAASHLNGRRYVNSPSLEKYLVDSLSIPVEEEMLDIWRKIGEESMLRLRLLAEGLDLKKLEQRYGQENIRRFEDRLNGMVRDHLLVKKGTQYRLPRHKVLTSNQVLLHVIN